MLVLFFFNLAMSSHLYIVFFTYVPHALCKQIKTVPSVAAWELKHWGFTSLSFMVEQPPCSSLLSSFVPSFSTNPSLCHFSWSSLANPINCIKWHCTRLNELWLFTDADNRTTPETKPWWVTTPWTLRASKCGFQRYSKNNLHNLRHPHILVVEVTNFWISL